MCPFVRLQKKEEEQARKEAAEEKKNEVSTFPHFLIASISVCAVVCCRLLSSAVVLNEPLVFMQDKKRQAAVANQVSKLRQVTTTFVRVP